MAFLKHSIFIVILITTSIDCVLANPWDTYNTDTAFPINFLFRNEIPNLENNNDNYNKIAGIFEKSKIQTESDEQYRLIQLGKGYILLKKNKYDEALKVLKNNIKGQFILEDYRLYYMAEVLYKQAVLKTKKNQDSQAISLMEERLEILFKIFNQFPESPFNVEIISKIIEQEILLGELNLKIEKYDKAWTLFRMAMLRSYENDPKYLQEITHYLLKNFEAAEDYESVIEIYHFLLNKYPTKNFIQEAKAYLEKKEKTLEKKGVEFKKIQNLIYSYEKKGMTPAKKTVLLREIKNKFESEEVQKFYQFIEKNNFSKALIIGYEILNKYPGLLETQGIIEELNKVMRVYIKSRGWNSSINKILNVYTLKQLYDLAFYFWNRSMSSYAAKSFKRILKRFPQEVQYCHKSLYFLGRIYEDKKEYTEAIKFYSQVIDYYNHGPYAAISFFKVPWVQRLNGDLNAAKLNFQKIINLFESSNEVINDSLISLEFVAGARYWLAQTEKELGNNEEANRHLKNLIDNHPLYFYSMLARINFSKGPTDLINKNFSFKKHYRNPNLSPIDKIFLRRAEELISIGFLSGARYELEKIGSGLSDFEFAFYLSNLQHQANAYQESIQLTLEINRKNEIKNYPVSIIELIFPDAYIKEVKKVSKKYNIDPFLILSLIRQESAFNKDIVSNANAIGLMQLIPSTGKRMARSIKLKQFSKRSLFDPQINISLGLKYIDTLIKKFKGNSIAALAAYNAGPNKVKTWLRIRNNLKPLEFLESIPFTETRNYVKNVLRNYVLYKFLYGEKPIQKIDNLIFIAN